MPCRSLSADTGSGAVAWVCENLSGQMKTFKQACPLFSRDIEHNGFRTAIWSLGAAIPLSHAQTYIYIYIYTYV